MTNPAELIQQTADILAAHDCWWREEEAIRQLKALWGDAINDCGVFVNEQEEVLYDKDGCKAEVSIAAAHGLHAYGCSYRTPTSGYGSAPSISGKLFTTYDAARTAGIEYLIGRLPADLYPHEAPQRERIGRMREALQAMLAQPSLF